MSRFDGKRVVIIGGNTGLGLAAAHQFVAEGARVAVTGPDTMTLEEAAKSLGKQALAVKADVTKISVRQAPGWFRNRCRGAQARCAPCGGGV